MFVCTALSSQVAYKGTEVKYQITSPAVTLLYLALAYPTFYCSTHELFHIIIIIIIIIIYFHSDYLTTKPSCSKTGAIFKQKSYL